MENLTNKELKHLIDTKQASYIEIKNILQKRVEVFTRVDVANMNIRVDLVKKQNEKDISLFIVLNNVYEHKDLCGVSISLPEKIRWFNKN